MKKMKFVLFLILASVLIAFGVFAAQINSTNYKQNVIVSEGGKNVSSSSYKMYTAVDVVNGIITSASYINDLGFFHFLLLANNQPCTSASQCEGGFCCSNLCQSSACAVYSTPYGTPYGTPYATPSQGGGAAGGGGGGGGGGGAGGLVPTIQDFSFDVTVIKATVKQGGVYQASFSIKNTGTESLSFTLDASALSELLLLSDTQFSLAPNEIKQIGVTVFAAEDKKPDVYSGNIVVKGGSITKSLPVVIEVQAKSALFDIKVKVLPQYKNVLKNEKVLGNITMINVGDLKPVDTTLYYSIRNIEGKDLVFGTETLAIYNDVSRIIELELPPNATFGTYLLYGKVSYGKSTASAADVFNVVGEKPPSCYDGIKNQNEEGIDCGGVCVSCKPGFVIFLNSILLLIIRYWLFIIIALIIIIILILLALYKRRKDEEMRRMKLRRKLEELSRFINSALSRGYKPEQVRVMLLSKGWQKEIADRVINKVISDRQKQNQARYGQGNK